MPKKEITIRKIKKLIIPGSAKIKTVNFEKMGFSSRNNLYGSKSVFKSSSSRSSYQYIKNAPASLKKRAKSIITNC